MNIALINIIWTARHDTIGCQVPKLLERYHRCYIMFMKEIEYRLRKS